MDILRALRSSSSVRGKGSRGISCAALDDDRLHCERQHITPAASSALLAGLVHLFADGYASAAETAHMKRGYPALVHVRADAEALPFTAWSPRGEDDPKSQGILNLTLVAPAQDVRTKDDGTGDKQKEEKGG